MEKKEQILGASRRRRAFTLMLQGAATVAKIRYYPGDLIRTKKLPRRSDGAALRGDWERIGMDLVKAYRK